MPDKLIRMQRSDVALAVRPTVLAIAGDSGSGKTTLARGLVAALGPERCASVCVDDYHRYDRAERADLPFTPLHPDCNHLDVMEQHLQLLALGRPVLKPVYDHATGKLVRPEYVAPREFLIIEGLHPLSTKLARACFDVTVFVDPEEDLRRAWKTRRDTGQRGYSADQVSRELARREPEAEAFIRPQRRRADIVVRFSRDDSPAAGPREALCVDLLLRSSLEHASLASVLAEDQRTALRLRIVRDEGTPTDLVHVEAAMPREEAAQVEKVIWTALDQAGPPAAELGRLSDGGRSEPLAISQLVLLHHLLRGTSG